MGSPSLIDLLARALMVVIPMVLSLSVHECAHAWVAKRLGDDTAERAGRLTLNPVAHADPLGTVILPLAILVAGGGMGSGGLPLFGWARPAPLDAGRLTRRFSQRAGIMFVAAAGPLSNLALALGCAAGLSVQAHGLAQLPPALAQLLLAMVMINVALCVFNLLPLSPLDGQKVVSGLLRPAAALRFEQFNQQYGTWALWGIILLGRNLISVPVRLMTRGVLTAVGMG